MIRINNLSFSYGSNTGGDGLKNINLRVNAGEFVLLTGKSGCGKSTLLNMISGIIPHHIKGKLEGGIFVDGKDVQKHKVQEMSLSVGSVFQNPKSQFFHLNTTDEILFSASNKGVPKAELEKRLRETTELFNMTNLLDRNIFKLSGGEKQKIACASTYAGKPKIFVFDEPSANLDQWAIDELHHILSSLKKNGYTVLVAEHRIFHLMDIADRIIYLDHGEIRQEYKIDAFMELSDEEREAMGLRDIKRTEIKKEIAVTDARSLTGADRSAEIKSDFVLEQLSYSYGKIPILDVGRIALDKGRAIAVIGKNGSGKSTLAHCLCGLKKGGTLLLNGKKLSEKKRLKSFELVMQDVNHQLFTESVMDEMLLASNGNAPREEIDGVLAELDLLEYAQKHPMALSGGQKQRLVIGASIMAGKDYLIFDEPTSGLDYIHMEAFAEIIKSLKRKNKLIFIITHDYELINLCCDSAISLERTVAPQ